ncbi:MAG: ABC transporter permease [Acidimicrobiia bacterium]
MFDETLRSLRERPARTMLTALGSVLGVATVVAIVGLSATASNQVSLRFDEILSTKVVVEPASAFEPERLQDVNLDEVRAINGVNDVVRYTTLDQRLASLRPTQGREVSVRPVVVSDRFEEAFDIEVLKGRIWEHDLVRRTGGAVAVMGETAALEMDLGGFDGPFQIWVDGAPVTVVGLIKAGEVDERLNGWVMMPEASMDLEAWGGGSTSILVRVSPGAGEGVAEVLPYVLDPESPQSFVALAPPEPEVLRANIESDTRLAFLAAGAIALGVGAVAIASATLTSVVERTEQFGIRRAFGARRSDIARLVLMETTVLGAAGGAVGCLLGLTGVLAFSIALRWVPVADPVLIPLAIAIGTGVGAFAGLAPAIKAAMIEPVAALRRI